MALRIVQLLLVTVAVLLSLCHYVDANTCIRHFSPTAEHQSPGHPALDLISELTPGGFSVLAAPYTSSSVNTIHTLQSTNASQADKEQWYRLDNTHQGVSYELRISNAAATGVDFDIALYSADDVFRLLNKTSGSIVFDQKPTFGGSGQLSVYAKVAASYTGFSTWPGVENWPVTYIIVLEKHVTGLPVQALKLIALLVVVVLTGLLVVTPYLVATIDAVAAEGRPKRKSS